MAAFNPRPAGSLSPLYVPYPQNGESDGFVNQTLPTSDSRPSEKAGIVTDSEPASVTPSMQDLHTTENAHHGGASDSHGSARPSGSGHSSSKLVFAARFAAVVILVSAPLAIPVIVSYRRLLVDDSSNADYTNILTFYLCLWLLTSWLMACAFNLFWRAFPYLFWWIAGFVNPAHQRYWRVFRSLNFPVTLLGSVSWTFAAFGGVSILVCSWRVPS